MSRFLASDSLTDVCMQTPTSTVCQIPAELISACHTRSCAKDLALTNLNIRIYLFIYLYSGFTFPTISNYCLRINRTDFFTFSANFVSQSLTKNKANVFLTLDLNVMFCGCGRAKNDGV